MKMDQVEMVTLDELVPLSPVYHKIQKFFSEAKIRCMLSELEHTRGADGNGIERLFKC